MKLFVKDDDIVKFSFFIKEEGGVLTDKKTVEEGEIDLDSGTPVTIHVKRPSYGEKNLLMQASTNISENGDVILNIHMYRMTLLQMFLRGWELKDEDGNEIPFETPATMRPDLAEIIINRIADSGLLP